MDSPRWTRQANRKVDVSNSDSLLSRVGEKAVVLCAGLVKAVVECCPNFRASFDLGWVCYVGRVRLSMEVGPRWSVRVELADARVKIGGRFWIVEREM